MDGDADGVLGRDGGVAPFADGLAAARQVTVGRSGGRDLVRWSPAGGSPVGLVALAPDPGPADGSLLDGIVLHMSRCGSTLLARLLAALPDTLVLHEPPVVSLALTEGSAEPAERARLLRRLVATCRATANRPAGAAVLKGTSWHLHHADALRTAFPDVPRVLVVRDPLEVLVSLVERPPGWLEPGPVPGAGGRPHGGSREERAAVAVAGYLEAAARAVAGGWLVIRHEDLPFAAGAAAAHLGLPWPVDGGDPATPTLAAVAADDAKQPGRRWRPDGTAKRARATPAVRNVHERLTAPAYERLWAAAARSGAEEAR